MNNTGKEIVTISYTTVGARLQEQVTSVVIGMKPECKVVSYAYKIAKKSFTKTEEILDKYFDTAQLIVFISATGIAVRKIAPYLKSKTTDPAVLCMDEAGRFVIPLVSGHLGGANDWAQKIAERIGATAVITTATDVENVFAVDLFAKKNGLRIADSSKIKEVSTRLLAGEKVGLCSDREISGNVPEGLIYCRIQDTRIEENRDFRGTVTGTLSAYGKVTGGMSDGRPECGITITDERDLPRQFRIECRLIPKNLILGIGCRKGISAEALERFVTDTLERNGLDIRRTCAVASIDLKKDEAGIRVLAAKLDVPYLIYSAEELQACSGSFTSSAFVASQVGVDNVCERSAMCAAGDGGRLLLKKTAAEGMTLAVASSVVKLKYRV